MGKMHACLGVSWADNQSAREMPPPRPFGCPLGEPKDPETRQTTLRPPSTRGSVGLDVTLPFPLKHWLWSQEISSSQTQRNHKGTPVPASLPAAMDRIGLRPSKQSTVLGASPRLVSGDSSVLGSDPEIIRC